MDEFPTSEDEFELMYGDELDLLREQEVDKTPKKSRKSLDFTQNPSSTAAKSLNSSFDDFTPLEDAPSTSARANASSSKDAQSINGDTILQDAEACPSHNDPAFQKTQPSSLTSNKRSIEELFGDIDDILYESQTGVKRRKSEHCDDFALIDEIVRLRKLAKERSAPGFLHKNYDNCSLPIANNLSYAVPNYPFVAVTRFDGQRVYIRCHSPEYELEERQRVVQQITQNLGADSDSETKEMWTEARKLLNRETTVEEPTSVDHNCNNTDLWVDLYKPRKYLELLSDESTNRLLLRWLKLWDKVVFKRRPTMKPTTKNMELDEHGRPFHKVALLCGPPGLGKTTLAHMVARHAGYNVVEVNASDDRSINAFRTVLETATQMRSVVDAERRPNCIVFDEIDGAPASSIDFLVKFVTGSGRNKKNQKQNVLRRPIICICNDVYVAALRPLRQIAFVVNFPPTSGARLSERLMEIARWQGVKTDLGAMMALSEKSHNDIRSCLSVLHLYKAQKKPVTLMDVHNASVGQKDMQKGLFAVWQDIFLIESTKQATFKNRMRKILDVVQSFGDYEKVAQGVFENYPNMKYKNSDMGETCWALEWFSYNDLLNQRIYSTQNYSLAGYQPFAFVAWHFTFASRNWQKLSYPNAGYEVRMRQNRQKAIISELIRGVAPALRPYVQPISLVLDIIPLLSIIIVPSFRPINLHLYTKDEKKSLDHVVNIMVDYNLNYVQERTIEGTYVYKLDPNLDEVVSFGHKKTLSYSNKQLVAKEIETVKMRRLEACTRQKQPLKSATESAPNHLQKLKARNVSSVEKPAAAKDFFGRVIAKSSSSGKSALESKNDIWYKYKEGYSNAVRKKIRIKNLL